MNSLNVIGRICNDIKMYENEDYKTVYFSVAVKRNKDVDDFIPCIAYNKVAEIILEYTEKGVNIGLTGRIETYKSDVSGIAINSLRFRVHRVTLVESKSGRTIMTDDEINRTAEIANEETEVSKVLEDQIIDDEDYYYSNEHMPF